MSEEIYSTQEKVIPSGYESVVAVAPSQIGKEYLPWTDDRAELATVRCTLQGGKSFLLASAIGTHEGLASVANEMTYQQSENCNNMFYSRIAGFVENGYHASNVDTMSDASPAMAVHVLRNKGGQRVYFGVISTPDSEERLLVKLAVCDKNMQSKVMRVFSSLRGRAQNRKINRGAN